MDSELNHDIQTAGLEARYDNAAKKLVSEKSILAYILKSAMDEFADYPVERIATEFIEGDPEVNTMAVPQDHMDKQVVEPKLSGSDKIVGEPTEDVSIKEGTIRYDIRFNVVVPQSGGLAVVLVNIEIQNNDTPGYSILKRGIYYGARMISAQRGTVFKNQDYGKIEKVVSIWLCIGTADERSDSINKYNIEERVRRGSYREDSSNYDLMTIVVMRLGKSGEHSEDDAIRLLSKLFSKDLPVSEKKRVLSEEFNIEVTEQVDEEVLGMCNLSVGIRNEGIELGREEGIARGLQLGEERGIKKGAFNMLFSLVKDGFLKMEDAASRVSLSVSEFQEQYKQYLSKEGDS